MSGRSVIWALVGFVFCTGGVAFAELQNVTIGPGIQIRNSQHWDISARDLSMWRDPWNPERTPAWSAEDGVLTNCYACPDIATAASFKDFYLNLSYKTAAGTDSGLFLRGRIELQIASSHGKETLTVDGEGAVKGQFAPLVNAGKPAGEWNRLYVNLKGNRLTVVLNGERIHDNVELTEVSPGALPGGLLEPGPIMIRGNSGKVWFRDISINVPPSEPEQK